MRLGIRMLNNSSTVNYLSYINQSQINPGESATIMFQLVDLEQQPNRDCPPNRYMPASGATISAKLTSVDASKNLTKIPTNPFPDDKSIFSFNLSAAETALAAGVNLYVTLTEGANIKIANGMSVLIMGPRSEFQC